MGAGARRAQHPPQPLLPGLALLYPLSPCGTEEDSAFGDGPVICCPPGDERPV